MSPIRKLIVLGVVLILVGGSLWLFASTMFSNVQNQNLHLGSEIKNYPLDDLSFTVTNWTLMPKIQLYVTGLSLPETPKVTDIYVIVNFPIRNIGNAEMDTLLYKNFLKLEDVTPPLLKYDDYYAQPNPNRFYAGWGLYSSQATDLMPNQKANGALVYEILEGSTPRNLLYPNKDSPTFVIDLSH